ncbi:MAG: LysR family transcriptional regulator, partial [Clostridia bacterium]|nr:LysR family transcriptional regulator [Clostridia bacterium]
MSANKYEAFVRVVELGSLTKAAEAIGVTQSAVSHMINSLEAEFGFSLLRRGRSGAFLTTEGERVIPAVRGILNHSEQLSQIVASIRGVETGTVRIGAFTSVAVHWLPGMIKAFQRDYPNVEIRLMNGDYHDVEQWLEEG